VHTNIDPDATKFKAKHDGRYRPDVAIIVFDAASMSNGLRSLQKTMKIMQESYSAILYPYLNKVAHNTYPNAQALLNGKSK
jgi:hypothetical protein